jgi:hypothetical protein
MSSVNYMGGQNTRSMPNEAIMDLSVHEQHAQAAIIIGMVERLPDPTAREYLSARFGGMTKPEHVNLMMNRVFAALGTGIRSLRDMYEFLLCYCGRDKGYKPFQPVLHGTGFFFLCTIKSSRYHKNLLSGLTPSSSIYI